jgi:hypothetical protein
MVKILKGHLNLVLFLADEGDSLRICCLCFVPAYTIPHRFTWSDKGCIASPSASPTRPSACLQKDLRQKPGFDLRLTRPTCLFDSDAVTTLVLSIIPHNHEWATAQSSRHATSVGAYAIDPLVPLCHVTCSASL